MAAGHAVASAGRRPPLMDWRRFATSSAALRTGSSSVWTGGLSKFDLSHDDSSQRPGFQGPDRSQASEVRSGFGKHWHMLNAHKLLIPCCVGLRRSPVNFGAGVILK